MSKIEDDFFGDLRVLDSCTIGFNLGNECKHGV